MYLFKHRPLLVVIALAGLAIFDSVLRSSRRRRRWRINARLATQ